MLYPSRGPRLEACPDTFQQKILTLAADHAPWGWGGMPGLDRSRELTRAIEIDPGGL